MPRLPGWCEHCNRPFETGIELGEGTSVRFVGSTTNCTYPDCGKDTSLLDGLWTVQEGRVALREGPTFTKEAVLKINAILANRQIVTDEDVAAIDSEIEAATGVRGFLLQMKGWMEGLGLGIDALQKWKNRVSFLNTLFQLIEKIL